MLLILSSSIRSALSVINVVIKRKAKTPDARQDEREEKKKKKAN
jgi:hypothetical protein